MFHLTILIPRLFWLPAALCTRAIIVPWQFPLIVTYAELDTLLVLLDELAVMHVLPALGCGGCYYYEYIFRSVFWIAALAVCCREGALWSNFPRLSMN